MRFEKHKGSCAGIEAHHERKKEAYKSNPDIDVGRSNCNIHLVKPEQRYRKEINSRITEAKTLNVNFKIRNNSVRFIDTLITASPNFFINKRPEEIERYFRVALKFFEEKVNEKNIVSAVIHMDESTPHLHLIFVPLTVDNRLSAKDIIGGPAGCRKWQDEFFEKMASEFPELLRGRSVETTGRQHLTVKKFKEATDEDNRFKVWTLENEVKKSRAYIDSIPAETKIEIDKHRAEEKKSQRNKNRER